MQTFRAAARGDGFQPSTKLGIAAGTRKQTTCEHAVVKTCSAGKNRQPAPRVDVADDGRRVERELRGRVFCRGIDDVDQVMRDAAALGGRQLVGADIETAI